MTLADDYNLRAEIATMNDVADFVDLFDAPLSWTPTYGVTAPMTISSTTTHSAVYYEVGDLNFVFLRFSATVGGTSRVQITASLPFTTIASTYHPLTCVIGQPASGNYLSGVCYTDGNLLFIRKPDGSEFTASTVDVNISGVIRL
jgi:hypothetical protein